MFILSIQKHTNSYIIPIVSQDKTEMFQLNTVNSQCQRLKVKSTGKPEIVTEMYIGDLMVVVPTTS